MKRNRWLGIEPTLYTAFFLLGVTVSTYLLLLVIGTLRPCLRKSNLLPTGQQSRWLAHLITIAQKQAYLARARRWNSRVCGRMLVSEVEGSALSPMMPTSNGGLRKRWLHGQSGIFSPDTRTKRDV